MYDPAAITEWDVCSIGLDYLTHCGLQIHYDLEAPLM